jgi:hypothetical protein
MSWVTRWSVNGIGEQSLPHRGVGHQLAGHTGRDRAHPGQLTGGVVDADQARQGDRDLPHQATTTGVLLGAGEQVVGGVEPQLIQAAGAALGLPLAGEGVDGSVAGSGLLHRADQPEDALAVGGVGVVPDPPLRSGVRGGLLGVSDRLCKCVTLTLGCEDGSERTRDERCDRHCRGGTATPGAR